MSENSTQIGGQPYVSVNCAGKDGDNTVEYIEPMEGRESDRTVTAVPAGKPEQKPALVPGRKPFGIIAACITLAVAFVCGAVFQPKNIAGTNTIKVGDHITFGSYPQNGVEPEPVEWRVLEVRDGKALMISEYLLDARKYDSQSNEWENSELRAWLNNEFLNKAFSPEEREKLNGIEGDKVSLLTKSESRKYFSANNDRMGITTSYARKNGANYSGGDNSGWWWLRSPAFHGCNASIVLDSGCVYDYGNVIGYIHGCVRPVVLVSLSDDISAQVPDNPATDKRDD